MTKKILVTGIAGFIGHACAMRLHQEGYEVYGIDNLNNYYDVDLKQARLDQLPAEIRQLTSLEDIADAGAVKGIIRHAQPNIILHLAAQAGVRYSLKDPMAYVNSNIIGHLNMLEACREFHPDHFVYASSSSVYGLNQIPFDEAHPADHPISLYGATKRADELITHSYAHLFNIPSTGLRFFTVYGPWGRPDMAPFKFIKAAFEGSVVPLYNHGNMLRDFTYIDDIVEGIIRVLGHAPTSHSNQAMSPAESTAPHRIYNIGNDQPETLRDFVAAVEDATGHKLSVDLQPLQPGDVLETRAEIHRLSQLVGFKPATKLQAGIKKTADWYRGFYGVS
ncbi:MAG: NAD-dependent epimerase/dehydratase family protein [SAR116 cluster bacterium]|nr:protein CapI [Paracoccaceae bacterium]RCL80154.1 MAG: NAD-dependent epimerase/dehydratase family protein [SAR116 cluster bacterium]HCJ61998.1 protein CapI [Alphaproteobacteria bacterium]|tara:strand:- start:489 stop:1493 length:1005 start_codon:yes stop_codon:yes gene_type:complete